MSAQLVELVEKFVMQNRVHDGHSVGSDFLTQIRKFSLDLQR